MIHQQHHLHPDYHHPAIRIQEKNTQPHPHLRSRHSAVSQLIPGKLEIQILLSPTTAFNPIGAMMLLSVGPSASSLSHPPSSVFTSHRCGGASARKRHHVSFRVIRSLVEKDLLQLRLISLQNNHHPLIMTNYIKKHRKT